MRPLNHILALLLFLAAACAPTHAPSAVSPRAKQPLPAPEAATADAAEASEAESPPANPNPRLPESPAPSAPTPSPIRVALYRAPGVSVESHQATLEVLREASGFAPRVVSPEQIREGILENFDVVLFTGGQGSRQGRALQPEGRQIVRDFVANGGGYIGVCAGSYLAMQGTEEFHKLAIVAARNLTGDAWRRGTATLVIREVGSEETHRLFYANGPVFAAVEHPVLPAIRPLATYVSDTYLPAHGTNRGEMPGTPAIIATNYGHGRIILFSPNPVLHAEDESPEPALMTNAVRWVGTRGPVPQSLEFDNVFR